MRIIILLIVAFAMPVAMLSAAPQTNAISATPSASVPHDYENDGSLLSICSLVAVGEIQSSPREVTRVGPHEHLWYYYYPFKLREVLYGTAPEKQTIEIAIVWSGEKGDPDFLKKGDDVILFLDKPAGPGSAWLAFNRRDAVEQVTPSRIAYWKNLIAAGPMGPFSERTSKSLPLTSLDLRISVVSKTITPVPKRLANGLTKVLELPIRIENFSTETIDSRISHEWYGGITIGNSLGAAVKKTNKSFGWWRTWSVYLSGEIGTMPESTIWKPGQSHEFLLRMNWPGTAEAGVWPLINATEPGKYDVRFSLVFTARGKSEYVVSPTTEIEVRE